MDDVVFEQQIATEAVATGTEIPLTGGAVSAVVRIGDTVRRSTGPWTPAIHALLNHLHGRVGAIPAVYGTDDDGREILDYLPGEIIDIETTVLSEAQLWSLTRWAREMHSATRDFHHPGPWRLPPPPGSNVIGHNDLSPWNLCFESDQLSGVFDWDLAGPTTAVRELAMLAWSSVPLFSAHPPEWVARRIRLISAGYGGPSAAEIFAEVFPAITEFIGSTIAAATAGDLGMQHLMSQTRGQDLTQDSLKGLRLRREAIEQHLDPAVHHDPS